jgi:DNA polymerase-4
MLEAERNIPRVIFHVDLDAFFVAVERIENPSLSGKPVIVGGRPQGRGVVASASYEARACGVHAAMPLFQARKLCPQAVFVTGHYQKYRGYSDRFMSVLADYTPVLEIAGLDEAYLDVTGCENYGSWRSLAMKIKQRVRRETGLIASIGIATCKVVAKVASDLSKPDGLIEVPAGQEANFLAKLPVQRLPGIGMKMAGTLHSMGITTVGRLADMPDKLFIRSFGVGMLWLLKNARGVDDRNVEPRVEAKSISREITFPVDTLDVRLLQANLRYFAEKIGAELRQHEKQARTITIKLRLADFQTFSHSKTSVYPTDLDDDIFNTAMGLLRSALRGKSIPVRLIGLEVSNLIVGERQLPLFGENDTKKKELNRAIDEIRSKYGFDAIETGYIIDLKQTRNDREN